MIAFFTSALFGIAVVQRHPFAAWDSRRGCYPRRRGMPAAVARAANEVTGGQRLDGTLRRVRRGRGVRQRKT